MKIWYTIRQEIVDIQSTRSSCHEKYNGKIYQSSAQVVTVMTIFNWLCGACLRMRVARSTWRSADVVVWYQTPIYKMTILKLEKEKWPLLIDR